MRKMDSLPANGKTKAAESTSISAPQRADFTAHRWTAGHLRGEASPLRTEVEGRRGRVQVCGSLSCRSVLVRERWDDGQLGGG